MSDRHSHPQQSDLRGAAVLLGAFVALSLTAYLGLTIAFGFPDILRRPAPEILAAFRARQGWVQGFYYLFAVAHLVLAAAVLVLHRALRSGDGPWLAVATGGGVLYGVAQTAGFLRWPILVPTFAERMAGELTAAQQDTTLLVLDAFHRYAGIAVGENLSFLGMAAWMAGIGITLMRPALGRPGQGRLWVLAGLLVFVYTFEQLGPGFAVLGPLLMVSHGLAYGLILALAASLRATRAPISSLAPVRGRTLTAIAIFVAALVIPGLV